MGTATDNNVLKDQRDKFLTLARLREAESQQHEQVLNVVNRNPNFPA